MALGNGKYEIGDGWGWIKKIGKNLIGLPDNKPHLKVQENVTQSVTNNTVQDTTGENVETQTNGNGGAAVDWIQFAREQQQAQWEREDAIRKETQEREDTAYQRAVKDMEKAGINPNLVGLNPAESGGGIMSASGLDLSMLETEKQGEIQKLIAEMQKELDQEFQGKENSKNRWSNILSTILTIVGMLGAKKL